MIPISTPVFFLDDLGTYLNIAWVLILFYLAYWIYKWVAEKLVFSQLLTFIVAGVLIYFLVIQNPIITALGIFGWIILTGGVLMILQVVPAFWYLFH